MNLYVDYLPAMRTWNELGDAFASWTGAYDASQRVLLVRTDCSVAVFEQPSAWRARHRRGLHRLGFRPRKTPDGTMWEWELEDEAIRAEVGRASDLAHQPDHPSVQRFRALLARDRLTEARCVVVLRDVFAFMPTDLRLVTLVIDEDDWDQAG